MIEYYKRCIHCGTKYIYQLSGEGCHEKTNNDNYCPDCMKVVIEALKSVEEKCKPEWVPCNDFTQNDVQRFQSIMKDEQKFQQIRDEKFGLINLRLRRVYPGLWDRDDPENKNITGDFTFNGITYRYSYWTKKNDFDLYKYMEVDAQTNEVRQPW